MKTPKLKNNYKFEKLYQQSKLAWGDFAKKESIYKYKIGYYKLKKRSDIVNILFLINKKFDKEYKIAISAERKFLKAIKPNIYKSYLQYLKGEC